MNSNDIIELKTGFRTMSEKFDEMQKDIKELMRIMNQQNVNNALTKKDIESLKARCNYFDKAMKDLNNRVSTVEKKILKYSTIFGAIISVISAIAYLINVFLSNFGI